MTERTPQKPPVILPLPDDPNRPRWSVMIPVYNCMAYLEQTLRSVLAQDPGMAFMQIEVVDDHSTDGDVAGLVSRIGKGRIQYYRQPVNRGSLRNFETCLNRARGEWIHLLHGDDRVRPGFYREIDRLFRAHPAAGAAFTNHIFINEQGKEVSHYKPLASEAGLLEDWLVRIAGRQYIQPPAIVVKREVYEQLGSFFAIHFGEDWEMWVRIAAHYPVAYSPRHLAEYRYHTQNISTRSFISGQSIRDIRTAIDIIQGYLPTHLRRPLRRLAERNFALYFANTSQKILGGLQQPRAAFIHAWGAWKMSPNLNTTVSMVKLAGRYLYRIWRNSTRINERRTYTTNAAHHPTGAR